MPEWATGLSAVDITWKTNSILWCPVLWLCVACWSSSNAAVVVGCRLTEAASGYVTLGIIFFVLRHRNRRRKWWRHFSSMTSDGTLELWNFENWSLVASWTNRPIVCCCYSLVSLSLVIFLFLLKVVLVWGWLSWLLAVFLFPPFFLSLFFFFFSFFLIMHFVVVVVFVVVLGR